MPVFHLSMPPAPVEKQILLILETGLSNFQELNYLKGSLREWNGDGQVSGCCALGALPALGFGPAWWGAADALKRALPGSFIPVRSDKNPVAQYSDLKTTSKADIVALYKRAIANVKG